MIVYLIFSLLLLNYASVAYDPLYFPRLLSLPISAAYSDDPGSCGDIKLFNLSNIKTYSIGKYFVFTAISNQGPILSFRGTVDKSELLEEIALVVTEGLIDFPNASGKVSKYFYDTAMSLFNGIKSDFITNTQNSYGLACWITGHSLGGALAAVTYAYLQQYSYCSPSLITFGQPRIGDADLAEHMNLYKSTYRITHSSDPVPHLPSESEGYAHWNSEYHYPNSMGLGCQYIQCTEQLDDPACDYSNSTYDECMSSCEKEGGSWLTCATECITDIEYHLIYYGIDIRNYCINGGKTGIDPNCGCKNACPYDTIFTCNPMNNFCYSAHNMIAGVEVAEEICNRYISGHVSSIHNAFENAFIANLTGRDIIVGLKKDSQTWMDGSPVDYTNWNKNVDPFNVTHQTQYSVCVGVQKDGSWIYDYCDHFPYEFVCKTIF